MNVYDTAFLQALVESLKRPTAFLLNTFFPLVAQSQAEEIKFDVEDGRRRIAPFVHPYVQGKLVESLGYQTKTFRPAYVKDKRVIDPDKPLRRMAGEQIGGTMMAGNREQLILASELQDQVDMLTRRLEVMASEALRQGQVTVEGDGYDTVVVNFGRDGNLAIDLAPGDQWGEAGVEPVDDLEEWAELVQKTEGAVVTDIVMEPDAFKQFRSNQKARDLLDNRNMMTGQIQPIASPGNSGQLKGIIGNWRIWTYQDWYIDSAGVEQPMMPTGTVLLAGTPQVLGTRHFGAIRDAELGYQALEFAPKSWIQPDPAVRYLMLQSAPLVVPYRPNATFRATVL
ncbi:major capsid protein [Sediminicurvatus halobius]|uniref:Capsid protein n=1 Tax=Sediminicurvatus halobius TaxID=2182432 RepID=A0A2U2MY73_9GAMM|nr:major capsid protein [Spiribacter halobius]PWG61768.1 capsid protein [Spiribacter halobius]UEX76798.1 major capsid protein [Spiribacter halobius]